MHPKLFTLPGGIDITTYGFLLMVGFLTAVWMAMKRAQRVKADPDCVLDASFYALVFGVGGARLMFVVHYWKTEFAGVPNPLLAIIDIRNGGLEFLGGLIGSFLAITVYLLVKRRSIRLYLDILAPGAMWGLAIGRLGCFFNGCCFGAVCPTDAAGHVHPSWAVEFPYGSAAFVRQWEERKVTVPAELVSTAHGRSTIVPANVLATSIDQRETRTKALRDALEALKQAKKDNKPAADLARLEKTLDAERQAMERKGLADLVRAQNFPSRVAPQRGMSVTELEDIAAGLHAAAVHPTQIYAAIHALLLSIFLVAIFNRRRRHGVVIGLLFLLYPLARIPEEIIRADNPHDVGGLTISQSISLASFIIAAVYLIILYRALPERSPALAKEEELRIQSTRG